MVSVEYIGILLLAPVAGALAWWAATRGRRGRRVAGWSAAVSAALMVVALAGIFEPGESALRVFLVDVSGSTRGAGAAHLARLRAAAAEMRPGDRVALIAFGRDAAVILPPTAVRELPAAFPALVGVDQDGTSVAAALELALALFPDGERGDIVLLTDGRETLGDAAALGPRLAAADKPVHSRTIAAPAEADAWVEAVRAPSSAAGGEAVGFEVVVGATAPMRGKLELQINDDMLAPPETTEILTRRTVLARRIPKGRLRRPGLHTLTARLRCPGDTTSENNEASAAVRVRGVPVVTYVSRKPKRALAGVLSRSGMARVTSKGPQDLGTTNEEMLGTDVIVLDDVSVEELGADRIGWLGRFVRSAGGGLVVLGGRRSFGPGGYAGTLLAALLPVDPDPERRAGRPSSVVVVADRSGSMKRKINDRQKIEFVWEAIGRAGKEFGARTGGRSDELSIVAFNEEAEVVLERVHVGTTEGAGALRQAMARIFPSGGTRIGPALDAARGILAPSALRRHIILVSDGLSRDRLDGEAIGGQMKAGGIVLSVLATAAKGNPGLDALRAAADATNGRFVMLETIAGLPAAMARETRTISGSLIREGRFDVERGPGTWLGGVAVPPPVQGYVITGARAKEAPPALTVGGAPLLAAWPRGLGRVVACTSSPEDWAAEWLRASPGIWTGLVVRAAAGHRQGSVTVGLASVDGRLRIRARSAEPLGADEVTAALLRPGGEEATLPMRQVGRLRYECSAEGDRKGTYIARVIQSGRRLGEGHVTVGYSAEWKPGGDTSAGRRLSQLTGGRVLERLGDLPPLEPVRSAVRARRNLGYIFLCLAAAAFLVGALR